MSKCTIQQVFQLIDSRGYGQLNIEGIFKFTDTLRSSPDREKVLALYRQFDVDGSGDIDAEEFVGFLEALENLTKQRAEEMVEDFSKRQYEELFELCDEDGGGTIDKAELKALIESLHGMLGLKRTAADVSIMMKQVDAEELDFPAFYQVMSTVVAGKPISQVVFAFREAQKRKSEIKSNAVQRFLNLTKPAAPKTSPQAQGANAQPESGATSRNRSMTKVCLNCAKKEVEIQELRDHLQALESTRATKANEASTTPQGEGKEIVRKASSPSIALRKIELSVEPKVQDANHSIESAVGVFRVYPPSLKAAVFHAKGRRIAQVAERSRKADFPEMARQISESAESAHRLQLQLMALVDTVAQCSQKMLEAKRKFLIQLEQHNALTKGAPFAPKPEDVTELAASLEAGRGTLAGVAESTGWVLEGTLEARCALVDVAMAGAPYSNKPQRVMECVLECETLSQELSALLTTLLYSANSSGNLGEVDCLIDEAVSGAPFVINNEQVHRLRAHVDGLYEKTKPPEVSRLSNALKQTVYNIQANVGTFVNRRRDRAVNTVREGGDVATNFTDGRVVLRPTVRPVPIGQDPEEELHSPPPRVRERKVEVESTAKAVDRLVDRYKTTGLQLPPNFGRVPQKGDSKRHTFQFGTRKIDLVVVDDLLAVIVGGGFLLFDEFCAKYCGGETVRQQRQGSRRVDPYNDSASPKRALVRGGQGLKLVDAGPHASKRSPSP